MKYIKTLATAASLLLLISCGSLDGLKKKPISGNNFNSELARNYLKFADDEAKKYDWVDSDHFAKKGIAASKGEKVEPEVLSNWHINSDYIPELKDARAELVSSLTEHNKNKFPKEAADAQSYFDCWIEEQEENWQKSDIVYCKDHYKKAIAQLHHVVKIIQKPVISEPVKTVVEEVKTENKFILYFDFDKYNIKSSEEDKLAETIKWHKKLGGKLVLSGHADDTGSDLYNDRLSAKRAEMVKSYLIKGGLKKSDFELHHYGKKRPAVPTVHGVKERLNRRVEIEFK